MRIAIISAQNQTSLSKLLEVYGYEVEVFTSITRLAQAGELPSVYLIDNKFHIGMEKWQGAFDAITTSLPVKPAQIILLSDDRREKEEAARLGVAYFFLGGSRDREFLPLIKRASQG